jgi:hypothetical protein
MHMFSDKESERIVREEEERMAQQEALAMEELGLSGRVQASLFPSQSQSLYLCTACCILFV